MLPPPAASAPPATATGCVWLQSWAPPVPRRMDMRTRQTRFSGRKAGQACRGICRGPQEGWALRTPPPPPSRAPPHLPRDRARERWVHLCAVQAKTDPGVTPSDPRRQGHGGARGPRGTGSWTGYLRRCQRDPRENGQSPLTPASQITPR